MSKYGKFEKVLNESWDSWERLLLEDVKTLDYRIVQAMDCAASDRVPRELVVSFFNEKFWELVEYVANHRETYKQQARRQQETILKHQSSKLAYIGRPSDKTRQKRKERVIR